MANKNLGKVMPKYPYTTASMKCGGTTKMKMGGKVINGKSLRGKTPGGCR